MNKTQLLLPILILILSCTSCAKEDRSVVSEQPLQDDYYAETYIAPSGVQSHGLYTESDLGYSKVGYFYKVDLNNDGEEEIVEVTEPIIFYTNLPDSEWGDDTWAVVRILNRHGEVAYLSDLPRYQPVESVSIDDVDEDGFKEIVISIGQTEEQNAKTYTYGWKDNTYKLVSSVVAETEGVQE